MPLKKIDLKYINIKVMDIQIELLRDKLEKLIEINEGLMDSEVISLSQELDKLIFLYYLMSP